MGCHPSKSQKELLKEIDFLRKQDRKHKKKIRKLKEKNKDLVSGEINDAASDSENDTRDDESPSQCSTEYHDIIKKLEKENEKLMEENKVLREGNITQAVNVTNHQGISNHTVNTNTDGSHSKNLPKAGDKVLAMWSVSMWQYFTASILSFDPDTLQFEINWDDQDPSGRIIDYDNLALDRVPDDDEIAVGSVVLFPQGQYKGQEGVRLGGQRWHQGEITEVTKAENGEKLYSGKHTKGEDDGKWVTFSGYNPEFEDLTIDQLRIAPNVLDLLSAEATRRSVPGVAKPILSCDVFLSYSKLNSYEAVQNGEIEKPPDYDDAIAQSFCDPREIKKQLEDELQVSVREHSGNLAETVDLIHGSKVVIAFLSDDYARDEICRQEFQYAKKTASKPVIPVVVGSSFEWMMTVVGLLIAGELYIHIKDENVKNAKIKELHKAIKKNVSASDRIEVKANVPSLLTSKPDIFISYCWSNSNTALKSNQITNLIGNQFADARKIKEDLCSRNSNLVFWLDIERLQTTNQSDESMSMFQQIASGINQAKVVIVFISDEYAKSDNCRSEFQFALTSLKKPIVPVLAGSGQEWRSTVIGLLASSQSDTQMIDMQATTTKEQYENSLNDIERSLNRHLGHLAPKKQHIFSAPMLGDHVVCHHQRSAFFFATVASFDGDTLQYTVNWDDKDPSGRTQSYKDLAIDAIPSPDQIGVDSIVFFPQGSYGATEGNNIGGKRFHQGVITNIHKDPSGIMLYDGHHTKGEVDGKWITYKGYQYEFKDLTIDVLRVAPNAMDALMACKQAFLLDD